jgi:glutamate-1-semialdehyde aminotransferase
VPRPRAPQSAIQSEAAFSSTEVLPWNDLDTLSSYLAREGNHVAAALMEPIMGPGYIEGSASFAIVTASC